MFHFRSLGTLSGSHSKGQRRKSPCVSGRAGESGYFAVCPGHSVLLTKTCPQEKLLYQKLLTNLGELKYPTQATYSLPVCPKGKAKHSKTKLRSTCEGHRVGEWAGSVTDRDLITGL